MSKVVSTKEQGLFIGGQWKRTDEYTSVWNKYTQKQIAKTADATQQDVNLAVEEAKQASKRSFPAYQRFEVLTKAADLLRKNQEEIASLLVAEVGKPIKESRGEVARAAQTLEISGEEAKRIHGEGVPIEAAPGSQNRQAFTKRIPVGVVAAITPFNVPLNLVCHKVGPAIAAGNSVVLKPASATPLSAIRLTEILFEAGLPDGRLNLLTGSGSKIGAWLCENPDVNMFTFTGSPGVGQRLRERAGLRKVALELGNNSATVIHHDANIEEAAKLTAQKSFNNAGQVCISVQRVYVQEKIFDRFLEKMKEAAEELVVGDPAQETTDIGPMISETEAARIENWVQEAVKEGAEVVSGGERNGVIYKPTILTNVNDEMKVCREEAFGPIVAVAPYKTEEEVIDRVNDSEYGLQAGIFTNSLDFAMTAADKIEVGGLIINDTPGYRVDHMPYGGVKKSGSGKEGPKYAIEEMTEERLVVFNL
ncbi:aldehyde dehydrogenase family protein [Salibacterium salarium]|uniref:3-sulfolactaldehyde dehydrogenase n=1 Tax=Salibacterium salarium TaxID=284579 RepID=A0A3R9RE89_9BACI|nr:aldehyde dehydrogenase family protein [Salibacterium salarium]RSL33510.1 aldehyde dehydrogenase family protein [Salibacterium salarium]